MTQYKVPAFLEEAFNPGYSYTDQHNTVVNFYTFTIGQLIVRDGRIIACDPNLMREPKPFNRLFPTGRFPAELSVGRPDNSDNQINCFARIKFSANAPVSWAMAAWPGQDTTVLEPGHFFGYGVDTGTGCFMDTSTAGKLRDFLDIEGDNYLPAVNFMDDLSNRPGLLWEGDDCNAAMFHTGVGDGHYGSYTGFDKDGKIVRLVTDFGLLHWDEN